MKLAKYSFGVGDRFAHQGRAQLEAFCLLEQHGVVVAPVWNKSNREHHFVGSEPASVLAAASDAVRDKGWKHDWYVDADHIQLATVDRFIDCSNFFTIDVADSIGKSASSSDIDSFVARHKELIGRVSISGLNRELEFTDQSVRRVAEKYYLATQRAGEIYRHIANKKGASHFVSEVSMDETDAPQTPSELLVILAALADQKIPLQTIAPKFTGRFNKGVDYVGDLTKFEEEFSEDIAVIAFAIEQYGLPDTLKLSIHSGSDKFSLYPIIRRCMLRSEVGIHVKTAGTTWLEEVIGLAESGGDGLNLVQEIYEYAVDHIDELCAPYASVIDIDRSQLPSMDIVRTWSGKGMAAAIRHSSRSPEFNKHIRQLLHVSFKLAAKAGERYTELLKKNEPIVSQQVTTNIWERHLKPLFVGG
jgi:hypothetical protein